MGNNVLVIAEQRDGVLKKVAFEMLGAGAELAAALGGHVEAALLGSGLGSLPDTLAQYGATKVYVADDESLARYSSEGYVNTMAAFIGKVEPALVGGQAERSSHVEDDLARHAGDRRGRWRGCEAALTHQPDRRRRPVEQRPFRTCEHGLVGAEPRGVTLGAVPWPPVSRLGGVERECRRPRDSDHRDTNAARDVER